MTVSAAGLFAGCASDPAPEQERDVQPLGSILVCENTAASLCVGAADPAACLAGLTAICPDVISVDVATCEAKFSAACTSFGLPQADCDAAATLVCTNFTTPGVCYDDTFAACHNLGGTDALCDSVATALCSNPAAVTCDQFVDKLCAAIPLNATDCAAAHQGLCAAGGPLSPGGAVPNPNPNPGTPTPTPVPPACDPATTTTICTPVDCPAWVQSICDANNVPQADCDARIAAFC